VSWRSSSSVLTTGPPVTMHTVTSPEARAMSKAIFQEFRLDSVRRRAEAGDSSWGRSMPSPRDHCATIGASRIKENLWR
jgi:hypothetical protein